MAEHTKNDVVAALLDALMTALPYVEVQEGDEHYKPGAVEKTLKKMRDAIAKAEAIQ